MRLSLPCVALALTTAALSQSNAIPGTDISVYDVVTPVVYGRTGPAWPNGTAGVSIGHSMANCGSVHVPWYGQQNGVMVDPYPKIAFLLARESGGRMVQISGKSFMKHSRIAFNFSGGSPCGPCQSGPSQTFRIGCFDIYSAGFNGSRTNLGPTTEVDPWLGTWDPLGSYFDIGDPAQANYPAPADSVQSLDPTGFDQVKNRMEVPEIELSASGNFYGQNQVVVIGEPVANRGNNLVSANMDFWWDGTQWNAVGGSAVQAGSVLNRWSGATTSMGQNGNDDGRFLVAVKVTGPVDGMWHYEYAVHNIDNHRGGASLRIPVCATARVENLGFRDIDQDPLDDWSMTRNGGSIDFLASASNPLDWNTFYNFYFDSDAAPVAGDVSIDQARLGPGALSVDVATTVPGLLGTEHLGAGCGSPAPAIFANGVPSSPNPNYGLDLQATPSSTVVLVFSSQAQSAPFGGCTVFVDSATLLASELVPVDASGAASYSIPIPPGMTPVDLTAQAFEVRTGGPLLGFLAASNGLRIRGAATGCP
jgi:hypothetical protein